MFHGVKLYQNSENQISVVVTSINDQQQSNEGLFFSNVVASSNNIWQQ